MYHVPIDMPHATLAVYTVFLVFHISNAQGTTMSSAHPQPLELV
jgi:hypothetical protein